MFDCPPKAGFRCYRYFRHMGLYWHLRRMIIEGQVLGAGPKGPRLSATHLTGASATKYLRFARLVIKGGADQRTLPTHAYACDEIRRHFRRQS